MIQSPIATKVVGVTFTDDYPANIFALGKEAALDDVPLDLVRDADNEHDPNAIKVMHKGSHIGHVPRMLAAALAGEIDAGKKWYAELESIVVSTDNTDQPGLKILIWREGTY